MRKLFILLALGLATAAPALEEFKAGDLVKVIGQTPEWPRASYCNVEWNGKGGKVNKQTLVGRVYAIDGEFVRPQCSYNSYYLRDVSTGRRIGADSEFPREWTFVPHWLEPFKSSAPSDPVVSHPRITIKTTVEIDGVEHSVKDAIKLIKAEIDHLNEILKLLEGVTDGQP